MVNSFMEGKTQYLLDEALESKFPGDLTQFQGGKSSWLTSNQCFWTRFFWLSAQASLWEGDKSKAQKELSIVLSHFMDEDKMNNPLATLQSSSVFLPHCKVVKELTADQVIHELSLIEVDWLLKNSVPDMLEKNMHAKCVDLLAPLLLSTKDVYFDVLHDWSNEGKGFNGIELSALDVLINSSELEEPVNVVVYLDCHRRKLQVLLTGAGLGNGSPENAHSFSENQSKETLWKPWVRFTAEEVKAISQSVSKIKSVINPNVIYKNIPTAVIEDIQALLLAFICNIANSCLASKSHVLGVQESIEQIEQCYLVEAATAFCKLQHMKLNVSIKSQAELLVAIHDMLAEFGICCAHGIGDEQEGTFLKLAIKHLLALDMKLKSNIHSVNKGKDGKFGQQVSKADNLKMPEQLCQNVHLTGSPIGSHSNGHDMEAFNINKDMICSSEKGIFESSSAEKVASHVDKEEMKEKCDINVDDVSDSLCSNGEIEINRLWG